MKISKQEPDVGDDDWLNTTEAIKAMGMDRTTFWRKVKAGLIRRRWRPVEAAFRFQGKELKRVWNQLKCVILWMP